MHCRYRWGREWDLKGLKPAGVGQNSFSLLYSLRGWPLSFNWSSVKVVAVKSRILISRQRHTPLSFFKLFIFPVSDWQSELQLICTQVCTPAVEHWHECEETHTRTHTEERFLSCVRGSRRRAQGNDWQPKQSADGKQHRILKREGCESVGGGGRQGVSGSFLCLMHHLIFLHFKSSFTCFKKTVIKIPRNANANYNLSKLLWCNSRKNYQNKASRWVNLHIKW